MSIWSGVVGLLDKIFEPAIKAIDEFTTTDEERLEFDLKKAKVKAEIEKAKIGLSEKILDLESTLIDAQQKVIIAEAQGDSWLQRNWRPSFMVLFGGIIAAYFMGWTPPTSEDLVMRLLDIVQGGLYGYMGLRSIEKVSSVIKQRRAKKLMAKVNKIDRMEANI